MGSGFIPFAGYLCTVIAIDYDNKVIVATLPMLDRVTPVELEFATEIEVIA